MRLAFAIIATLVMSACTTTSQDSSVYNHSETDQLIVGMLHDDVPDGISSIKALGESYKFLGECPRGENDWFHFAVLSPIDKQMTLNPAASWRLKSCTATQALPNSLKGSEIQVYMGELIDTKSVEVIFADEKFPSEVFSMKTAQGVIEFEGSCPGSRKGRYIAVLGKTYEPQYALFDPSLPSVSARICTSINPHQSIGF